MNRATQTLRATGPPGAQLIPQSRATTASSAKNQAVAALTTTLPSTETIMASTTSDSARRDGKPRGGAVVLFRPRRDPRPRSGHHHRLRDCRRRRRHHQRHGRVPARPLAERRHAVPALQALAHRDQAPGRRLRPRRVRTGAQSRRRRRGTRVRRLAGDPDRLVRSPRHRLPGRPGRHDQAARHRQGQRRQGRGDRRVRARGFNPADDNEADALAILLWAIETHGGVR